jgi:hypothetical protein
MKKITFEIKKIPYVMEIFSHEKISVSYVFNPVSYVTDLIFHEK